MDYKNATCVLPENLITAIQQHIDGEYLYIPRKNENKKAWGELKNSRKLYAQRNAVIFEEYKCGMTVEELSSKYFLSPKSVYKILSNMKNKK
ncbi:CD3324 family protein [Anaerotignum sp.]|uniref:CD3324 family protein n=1 Tax=Anaerotignum sp. TaxID=2039241 RepID=UPI00289F01EC|nr:CD3324 family protein [Anaerotignum sp.]